MSATNAQPEEFEIIVGSTGGSAWGVRLDAGSLAYLCVPYSSNEVLTLGGGAHAFQEGFQNPQEWICVAEQQWAQLFRELDRIGLWDWEEHYDCGSDDADTFWTVRIVREGQLFRTGGFGAWPGESPQRGYSPQFKEFLSVIRSFLADRDFGHF